MKFKEESNRTYAQYQKKFLLITNIFIVVRAFLLFIPFEKILFEFRDLRRKISKSHIFRSISVNYDRNIRYADILDSDRTKKTKRKKNLFE